MNLSLGEVARVPFHCEKAMTFGCGLCIDMLLHEITYTPIQAFWAALRLLGAGLTRPFRRRSNAPLLSVTQEIELVRFSLLSICVVLFSWCVDYSKVYHFARAQSFVKLYVLFNMLEIFERLYRSFGLDLFDDLFTSVRLTSWTWFFVKCIITIVYSFIHTYMHLLRVLVLNVAMNSSETAMFLIILTNNFGELKSCVFKKYTPESLCVIVASDLVERTYLLCDILVVSLRVYCAPRRTSAPILTWIGPMIFLEISTDWIKFLCISKFSKDVHLETFGQYKDVLIMDFLTCRLPQDCPELLLKSSARDRDDNGHAAAAIPLTDDPRSKGFVQPLRNAMDHAHATVRRVGLVALPMSTLILCEVLPSWQQIGIDFGKITWRIGPVEASELWRLLLIFVAAFLTKIAFTIVLFGRSLQR